MVCCVNVRSVAETPTKKLLCHSHPVIFCSPYLMDDVWNRQQLHSGTCASLLSVCTVSYVNKMWLIHSGGYLLCSRGDSACDLQVCVCLCVNIKIHHSCFTCKPTITVIDVWRGEDRAGRSCLQCLHDRCWPPTENKYLLWVMRRGQKG